MKRKSTSLTIVLLCVVSMSFSQSVDWTNETEGTMNGITVTFSNIINPTIANWDFSGSDFSAAPLSSSTECIDYSFNSDWTITFNDEAQSVKLYMLYWRGLGATVNPVTYIFDKPFTVLSGLSGVTVDGNILSIPNDIWANGIIEFDGKISDITIETNGSLDSRQLMTFSYSEAVSVKNLESTTINVYPNPSRGIFTLNGFVNYQITVSDIRGKVIFQKEILNASEIIDISSQAAGIYVLKLHSETDVLSAKIIKY